ncbi:MAG TPA: sialidase family protein [Gemmatimonadaceae bacterium]|nr:sialidase family protein [Gemmatimonadaceae bacterium]
MQSIHRPRALRAALLPALVLLPMLAACAGDDDASGTGAASGTSITFGAVDTLDAPAAPGSGEPNLAADPDGRVYLSWLEPVGDSAHALRVSVLDAGTWSAPRTVVTGGNFFVNWADFPSLLPLGGGRLAAHWLQRSGEGRYAYDVRLARSADDGATWSESVVPHRDGTETEHGFVAMWPAGGDSVGVAWLDGRQYAAAQAASHDGGEGGGGEMSVATAMLAADGRVTPERLLDTRTCDCCQTAAAVTSRGPVLVYRDRSPGEIRDISVVRMVDGTWTEPAPLHEDGWEIAACPVNGPAVAARGERVAVAWFTGARDTARVLVAFSSDAGATWSAPVRVDDGTPAGRVDLAMTADGTALVSWLERGEGESAAVRLRAVSADGAAGKPVTVARSGAARSSGFPRMALSGDALVLAWTEPGTPARVRTARVALGGGGAE